ncbi:MAG TPA: ATP-binding protein [Streptosporangiaceae bacterium]
MADGGEPPARPPPAAQRRPVLGGPIALRLALAFVAVALIAVALLAGLTAVFAAADVSHLASQQRTELARATALAAGAAWESGHSWTGADVSPVLDLAAHTGALAQIRDQAGTSVASSPRFAAHPGSPQLNRPVEVRGQSVGQVVLRYTGSGLGRADQALQTALLTAIAGAAGLAALLALLAGLAVARRITRPVDRLIAVTRAIGAGDRTARTGPLRAPGELQELATAFDQMADALDRQEQLRRDLVADVAHELRTPIAVLQAEHEALIDGITEATPDQLASLRDEVVRLTRIVDDLQTLAEADAAALRLARSPADLAAIAAAAADSQAGRFAAAGVTLTRQLEPVQVRADAGRIHQVVANLLTNAVKFTGAGGRVTISTGQAGGAAVLRVTDTGIGIPAGELPRIFDRFWRGRQAAHTSGSGIGLSVAAELARAHGGELTASSTEGRGTEMTLTLPLA